MEKELHKIDIIPAKFIEKTPDNKYIVRFLLDNEHTEDYLLDSFSLEGMKNPKYLLIGIMTGVGFSQVNFCQADEFEKYFKTKWKILTK
jgi:hypothetical protein